MMPETVATNERIEGVVGTMLSAAGQALQRHVGQEVVLTPLRPQLVAADELVRNTGLDHAVARGALGGELSGHWLALVLTAPDAAALACHLMMAPADVIEERRRAGVLAGEELETFGDVANVLFSSFDTALRHGGTAAGTPLRAHDHAMLAQGVHPRAQLGDERLVAFPFTLAIAATPPSHGWLLLDPTTAERWNGQPLLPLPEGSADGEAPAAPIQGRLTAYLSEPDVFPELKQSCRRVGLELDRRAHAEVPNPAEHKDGIVLLDVPNGDTRRFEWCKRLKHYHEDVRVALLIHHPSRARVLQGFLAKADAIMGWPIGERELSEKLATLMAD